MCLDEGNKDSKLKTHILRLGVNEMMLDMLSKSECISITWKDKM